MGLFAWYGVVGLATLAAVLRQHWFEVGRYNLAKSVLRELHPERRRLGYRLLNDCLVPALAALAVIGIWPVAWAMLVRSWLEFRRSRERELARQVVARKTRAYIRAGGFDRSQAIRVEELTAQQPVANPDSPDLGDAPLEKGLPTTQSCVTPPWQELLEDFQMGDEIWTYVSRQIGIFEDQEIRHGYAIVRAGVPGRFIVCNVECVDSPLLEPAND